MRMKDDASVDASVPRYSVGQRVAFRFSQTWLKGTVRHISRSNLNMSTFVYTLNADKEEFAYITRYEDDLRPYENQETYYQIEKAYIVTALDDHTRLVGVEFEDGTEVGAEYLEWGGHQQAQTLVRLGPIFVGKFKGSIVDEHA